MLLWGPLTLQLLLYILVSDNLWMHTIKLELCVHSHCQITSLCLSIKASLRHCFHHTTSQYWHWKFFTGSQSHTRQCWGGGGRGEGVISTRFQFIIPANAVKILHTCAKKEYSKSCIHQIITSDAIWFDYLWIYTQTLLGSFITGKQSQTMQSMQ